MIHKSFLYTYIVVASITYGIISAHDTPATPPSLHNHYQYAHPNLSTAYFGFSAGVLINLVTQSKIVRLCALYPIVYCGKILLEHKDIVNADLKMWYGIAQAHLNELHHNAQLPRDPRS